MADFMIRFLFSSLILGVMIGLLLALRHLFRHTLTSRMRYRLWYVLLLLLAVPFLPLPLAGSGPWQLLRLLPRLGPMASSAKDAVRTTAGSGISKAGLPLPIRDLALSVGRELPSAAGTILFLLWILGILVLLVLSLRSQLSIRRWQRSSLPLQHPKVRALYERCRKELHITREIPVYSTAFLTSPVMTGVFRPAVYLPIRLLSDLGSEKLRYLLLHELQHYKRRDALTGHLMNLAGILYWFHPLVWYALREMRTDRELACDASVLELLERCDYEAYGRTLIDFAEQISRRPFSAAIGIGGNMRQIRQRILQISAYAPPSAERKRRGAAVFGITALLFLCLSPLLSTCATDQDRCHPDIPAGQITTLDLSSYFHGYQGSFVLYDPAEEHWSIYDPAQAAYRTSPNSTYKIYSALFGLEEGILTPEDTRMAWDEKRYPFEEWNADQDLYSAMASSVNWYFQAIDEQLGMASIRRYLQTIDYGNEDLHAEDPAFWMQSSLKISPIEQVKLLTDFYDNAFGFAPEHIDLVKDALCLSSGQTALYGKTGTGCVEEQDVNGWFVGFIETEDRTCFFAVNILGEAGADGRRAAGIAMDVLAELGLWNPLSAYAVRP